MNIIYEKEVVLCGFCGGAGCYYCNYTGEELVIFEVDKDTGEIVGVEDSFDYNQINSTNYFNQ